MAMFRRRIKIVHSVKVRHLKSEVSGIFGIKKPFIGKLPEDSASREIMAEYKSGNTLFHIEYLDSPEKGYNRDIEIIKFLEKKGKLFLYAYCHSAKAMRELLVNRITLVSFDGHTVHNSSESFWDKYNHSKIKDIA